MGTEQLEVERESFALWFEREFPDWCVMVGEMREAGQSVDQIVTLLTRLCYLRGIHPLFVVGARQWLDHRYGGRVYVPAVRFN